MFCKECPLKRRNFNIKSKHPFLGFLMQLKYLYFSSSFVFPSNKFSLEYPIEKLYHRDLSCKILVGKENVIRQGNVQLYL